MPDYRVDFTRSARKELEKLPDDVADRVLAVADRLTLEPRPPGARKLQGADLWRIRVGDYRVIYAIDDALRVVDVRVVRNRKDAYR